jgi:hypothetical protein
VKTTDQSLIAKHIIEEQHKTPFLLLRGVYASLSCHQHPCQYPLCSLQTCKSLYLPWQNQLHTRANILFAVRKLGKACICPGETDFRALIWLMGYL